MSVLSDQEIWFLIQSGRLKVDPTPDERAVSPSAIDLTLGNSFQVFEDIETDPDSAVTLSIDLRRSASVMDALARYSRTQTVEDGESFSLQPGRFVLAWTRERITLPNFLAARVEGRSTPARVGLSVHQSAPTVHATFSGQLQLEMTNAGPFTIQLFPGQPICQLILETLSIPASSVLHSVHQSPF